MRPPHLCPRSSVPDTHTDTHRHTLLRTPHSQDVSSAAEGIPALLTPPYTVSITIRRTVRKPRSQGRPPTASSRSSGSQRACVALVLCRHSSSIRASLPCARSDSLFTFPLSKSSLVLSHLHMPVPLPPATTSKNAAQPATHRPTQSQSSDPLLLRPYSQSRNSNKTAELSTFFLPPQIKSTLINPAAPTPSTSQDIHVQRVARVNLPRTSR